MMSGKGDWEENSAAGQGMKGTMPQDEARGAWMTAPYKTFLATLKSSVFI